LSSPTVAAELARAIAAIGCRHVFALMGDGNMGLVIACDETGLEIVEVRHEAAALAMAEGYCWSTGPIGVCTVTHGPGLTQLATPLVVAARNRSSVLVIAGEVPERYSGAQRFGQEGFVLACEAEYLRLQDGEAAAAAVWGAAERAVKSRGPVVLAVPADALAAPAAHETEPSTPPRLEPPTRASAAQSESAAALLREALTASARPVIVAGRGLTREHVPAVVALADRLGTALTTTLPAKGLFSGHPSDLGVCGGLSHPAAQRLLHEADLVLGLGTSLGRSTTRGGALFPAARIIRLVDEAPATVPADQELVLGEVGATVAALIGEAAGLGPAREPWFQPPGPPSRCWEEDLNDHAPPIPAGAVDPRLVLKAIDRVVSEDAIVVMSNGHCSGFVAAFVDAPSPERWFTAQGFGSIGQAFTTAIGVALGAPGRKVVAFEGDAAFMMHLAEVETAARAGADVTLFVLDDDALGTEYQRLEEAGDRADLAIVPTADLAVAARGLGARSARIDQLGDAEETIAQALAPGLAVIDVRIARSVRSRHMRRSSPERQATVA
jgi:thiamine pyrophosphate-dependent acetolactate synthase large subunit-like protein